MNQSQLETRLSARKGFTLVEVTLALAIVALAIVTILGLLPHGIQASRDAADNTLAATIVQDTFSGLRSQPFNNAAVCDHCGFVNNPKFRNLSTWNSTTGDGASNAYTQAGDSTNKWAGAYYKVILRYERQFPSPSPVTRVTATVVWPAQSKSPINTNIFVTEVAQYDK